MDQLPEELRQIQQFVLLYPPQGDKGHDRVATVLSKLTLTQQAVAKSLGYPTWVVPVAAFNVLLQTDLTALLRSLPVNSG